MNNGNNVNLKHNIIMHGWMKPIYSIPNQQLLKSLTYSKGFKNGVSPSQIKHGKSSFFKKISKDQGSIQNVFACHSDF